jgi:hypothetical protein
VPAPLDAKFSLRLLAGIFLSIPNRTCNPLGLVLSFAKTSSDVNALRFGL